MRRRRSQTAVDSPRLLARFLNHACEVERVTQSVFVKHVGAASSAATISRLFRGEVAPTDRDLQAFSEVLRIPIETLTALRIMDSIPDRRMLATTGILSYMIAGTNRLLLAGFTLGLGIGQLRAARTLDDKTVLVDLVSPQRAVAIENQLSQWSSGDALASWVSVARTLVAMVAKHPRSRIRLWVRDSECVDESHDAQVGELIANDWIAIEAPPPYRPGHLFQVRFYRDARWSALIDPLLQRLSDNEAFPDHELIWDSSNESHDRAFRLLLSKAADEVSHLDVRRGGVEG